MVCYLHSERSPSQFLALPIVQPVDNISCGILREFNFEDARYENEFLRFAASTDFSQFVVYKK